MSFASATLAWEHHDAQHGPCSVARPQGCSHSTRSRRHVPLAPRRGSTRRALTGQRHQPPTRQPDLRRRPAGLAPQRWPTCEECTARVLRASCRICWHTPTHHTNGPATVPCGHLGMLLVHPLNNAAITCTAQHTAAATAERPPQQPVHSINACAAAPPHRCLFGGRARVRITRTAASNHTSRHTAAQRDTWQCITSQPIPKSTESGGAEAEQAGPQQQVKIPTHAHTHVQMHTHCIMYCIGMRIGGV